MVVLEEVLGERAKVGIHLPGKHLRHVRVQDHLRTRPQISQLICKVTPTILHGVLSPEGDDVAKLTDGQLSALVRGSFEVGIHLYWEHL